MRIRSKLVTLIAVPLIALTLVAAFGFSNQSLVIETAEQAESAVARNQAVQDAVLAIGSERLLNAGGETASLEAVQESTDAALAALQQIDADSSATTRAAVISTDLVEQARTGDADERSGLFGAALNELLTLEIDSAADYPSATARNTAVANHTAVQALQLREWAWIAYFQLDDRPAGLDQDAVASVISDFAVADGTLRTAVNLAEAGGANEFNSVLQTNGAVQLGELQTKALDDLSEGDITVTSEEAIAGLIDYRTRWAETITEQGQALGEDVTSGLKSANDLRSLFALLAILGSVVLAGLIYVMYRSITSPLEALLIRASEVADVELPQLMTALRDAEGSDSLPEARPIPVETSDEIGELVEAFNNVQTTAYDLATEQALSRRNVADMFVNLGRRNQQLLQRILGQLTQLEQHEEDPDKLRELFELDNIVTRMRRNAESLLALAGAQTARQWSQPIEMENTVRAAFGEVEGYERINVAHLAETKVAGRVVADITHLLAELLENALNFSDSQTNVEVNGHVINSGYLITITDQGIGMSLNELDENNSRITDPPPLDQVPTRFLGLYVVGRLAERHGIEVRLTEAELTGTIARVMLPNSILSTELSERTPDIEVIDADIADPSEDVEDDAIVVADEVVDEPVIDEEISTDDDEFDVEDDELDVVAEDDNEDEEDATDEDEADDAELADAELDEDVSAESDEDEAVLAEAESATDAEADSDEDAGGDDSVDEPEQTEAPALAKRKRKAKRSRKQDEDRSPLEETHDLEAELAALTGDEPAEADDSSNKLPRRNRRSDDDSSSEVEADAGDADTTSSESDPSDWVGLPVRQKGSALDSSPVPEVSKAAVERRAATETSASAANNFSSMLSAFSSGISQGLEAAEDEETTKGEDR